eukprot:TRINITY_DN93113_c0_g1_i1.p1 TRINITY_DN93113_c0_g1~~TRINITY_DN93113_c0_g1_i1.p1  ORF type:complete len:318 (+),score=56.04 TRINITY_DN93113_c0_g1_i1:102-1055(+)
MPAEPRPLPNPGPNGNSFDLGAPDDGLGSGTGILRQAKPDVGADSPSGMKSDIVQAPKAMPVRFVCHECGHAIATSDSLVDSKDDVVVFSRLYCKDAGAGVSTVTCPECEEAVGTRGDGAFALLRSRLLKSERLEIVVCSLKQQEISEISAVLSEVFPQSNVRSTLLVKAELRGFQLTGKPVPDLVVVVHRNEGRALLTDRNGFYHDVLGSSWQQTRGNILVVLTRTEPKAEADLFDASLLRSLSTHGDQPTIGAISALGRVLTWGSAPSTHHRSALLALMTKAYFREPPPAEAPGIPGQWTKPAAPKQASAWCALL